MRLTKRAGVWYLDYRTPLGKRKRLSTGEADRAKAEARAHDLMSGVDLRSDVWTLRKALEHTYATTWQHQKSYRSRASIVDLVTAEIGTLRLSEITYAVLTEYTLALLAKDLKPATVNRRLATISKAMTTAQKLGKVGAVPPMPKQIERNKKLRWLTEEEEDRLFARTDILPEREAILMRHIIGFLLDTGARLGEMLKLEPADVYTDRVVFRDTKDPRGTGYGKSRAVPTTKRAHAAAKEITRAIRLGSMFNASQVSHRVDRVCRVAGIGGVTAHTFRHTCASRLVQAGVDLYRVKTWLGHSTVVVTERYAHLAPSSLDDMTAALERGTVRSGVAGSGHSATNVSHLRSVK